MLRVTRGRCTKDEKDEKARVRANGGGAGDEREKVSRGILLQQKDWWLLAPEIPTGFSFSIGNRAGLKEQKKDCSSRI